MKYLCEKDNIADLEKGIKNKFRWDWLNIEDKLNEKINFWCRKVDIPGTVYCTACNTSIKYCNEGLKSLLNHSGTAVHKKRRESVKNSQLLFSTDNFYQNDESRTVDLQSRKARSEALILSFLAEHSLSYSLTPHIVDLVKTVALDNSALNSLQLSRTTASYKLKYGLAKTMKDEQIKDLRTSTFSLNIDESKNVSFDSILTVLVQYFSEKENDVVLRHLASVKLTACDAEKIYQVLVSIFLENGIPWEHLMSILMDSCNTMRGVNTGVEKRIRDNKATHLLDIDGETCHTANNCAKKFTEPFLKHLEILCDNVYFDLKSTDKREKFFEICIAIHLKPLKVLSRPDHRWLYILPVLERIHYLWDALLLFYFSWMNEEDAKVYKDWIKDIYEKHALSTNEIKQIESIQTSLKKKNLTPEGKKRKERIIQRLFLEQQKTLLHMNIYNSILPHFNKYVKIFQSKECQLHELHVQMFHLMKQFLTFFIKHELVCRINTIDDILKIDFNDASNFLPDKHIFGIGSSSVKSKHNSSTVKECTAIIKNAYGRCAEYMKKKLPLKNPFLIKLSALNPSLRGETTTFAALLQLAKFFPTVVSEEELLNLDLELRLFQIDTKLSSFDSNNVIHFWKRVFEIQEEGKVKYPILSKMIKSVLSCFHGPAVESTFNVMNNIMTEKRSSLNIESLDSIQTIKYYLKSVNKSTCLMFGSKDPAHEPLQADYRSNLINSWGTYQQSLQCATSEEPNDVHSDADNTSVKSSEESSDTNEKKRKATEENSRLPKKNKQTKIASFFKK